MTFIAPERHVSFSQFRFRNAFPVQTWKRDQLQTKLQSIKEHFRWLVTKNKYSKTRLVVKYSSTAEQWIYVVLEMIEIYIYHRWLWIALYGGIQNRAWVFSHGVKEFLRISYDPWQRNLRFRFTQPCLSHHSFCSHVTTVLHGLLTTTVEKHDCLVTTLLWKFPLTCHVTRSLVQNVGSRAWGEKLCGIAWRYITFSNQTCVLINMDDEADSSDCFCDLCSLDFTTHRVGAGFASL